MTSHHNCKDSATVTAGGVRYELTDPNSAMTSVSAFMGASKLWGPVIFTDSSCKSSSPSGNCPRGGPCP